MNHIHRSQGLHVIMFNIIIAYIYTDIFVHLSIYPSIYLSIHPSIYTYLTYLYLSIPIYIYLYLSISVYISIYFYLSLSISIYLYLSLSISIYLYLFLSISIYLPTNINNQFPLKQELENGRLAMFAFSGIVTQVRIGFATSGHRIQ